MLRLQREQGTDASTRGRQIDQKDKKGEEYLTKEVTMIETRKSSEKEKEREYDNVAKAYVYTVEEVAQELTDKG